MVNFWRERTLLGKGLRRVAGVDEAGRGPLAGPVVSAAVILRPGTKIKGLDDSKKLSSRKRSAVFSEILKKASGVGIGIVDERTIDRINILQASLLSMKKAVQGLRPQPDFILVDGNRTVPGVDMGQIAVIGGDGKCASIAAASVVAKVTRDGLMMELHAKHPEYGFDSHKGYGTKKHIDALNKYGVLSSHRKSFSPVALVIARSI